ncbi:uncharacterized protein BN552_02139 [Blautia sp. CAG:237]|nr:uncharacterized protein BN552_02139 [Blautia sp. CAG:237]
MDQRDRLTPVSLAVECPVFHLVLNACFTDALLLKFFQHTLDRIFLLGVSVEEFRVDHLSVTCVGFLGDVSTLDDFDDVDAEFLCEIIVTLVMSRYCHDRTCTITHHYIVCNVDRDLLAVYRVDSLKSLDTHTCLVLDKLSSLELCLLGTFITVCSDLVHVCDFVFVFVDDRMLRCDYHESNTKQSIRSGCINLKLLVDSVDVEVYKSTLGFTDPVDLLLLYIVRIVNVLEAFQEFVCVLSDPQIPYVLGFLHNFAVADIAFAALAVLIGKNDLAVRAVVYKSSVSEYETLLKHFEEDPLCPFVVILICSIDHTVPVKGKSNFL